MSDVCREIAKMGKGIGNESRYRILEALMKGPRTVGEITAKTGFTQPSVSQHLKVLKSANLVEDERKGQEVYYSINIAYTTNLLRKLAVDVAHSKQGKKNNYLFFLFFIRHMQYETLAQKEVIAHTIDALAKRGIESVVVNNRAEALEKVKSLIPKGASVMNGSSRTLEEIGFVDYLKSGIHGWRNVHEEILAEKDPAKQATLRKQAVLSDYYLGSVHAVAETGQLVIASNSGSQLPHIVFTSPNLIFVAGAQKIAPDLDAAMQRVRNFVLPLEDKRMKEVGMGGSAISKLLIFEREPVFMGRKVYVIFVNEKLGF